MEEKAELRRRYRQKRIQLGARESLDLSSKIVNNALLYLADKPHFQHIHVFLPIKRLNEINTFPLIKALAQQNKTIYTSISDHDAEEMNTVSFLANQDYIEDAHGIPMPTKWDQGDESQIQLIFMPLLAYDLNGHRLGYGKGFYDKFLSKLPEGIIKAGLSYFDPETRIPVEPHDVPLDICINPDEIIAFKI